jgi:Protein of unknown function (DUF1559)
MPHPDDEYDDFDRDDRRPPPRRRSNTPVVLIVLLIVGLVLLVCGAPICIGLLLPAVQKVREAANRKVSENNLKEIGLGMYNYETAKGEVPHNSFGPDGKPLLSWRVHILPYVGENALYQQFKLDEPWDSPNNIQLLGRMPRVYASPQERNTGPTRTYYRGFSSRGAVFEHKPGDGQTRGPNDRLTFATMKDGTSNTILVVEAGEPVEWTKPDDLDASPGKPLPPLGGHRVKPNKFQALMADGSVKLLDLNTSEATLRALVTHSGGEPLPPGWDQ